jgi:cephalosporin hydroxylase
MAPKVGSLVVDRPQPVLSLEERRLVEQFHDLYYRRWRGGGDTINLSWFGYLLWKCPFDLWVYQELLVRTKPDFVVETGTFAGGSALYLASIFDLLGHGQVLSIDLNPRENRPEHPRIEYITGSSTDPAIVEQVKVRVKDARAMVILDSDHHAAHVYQELLAYQALVQPGDYLVVEDTNVNGHPAFADYGPGPMEAVERFLTETEDFQIDHCCNRFLMTLNPQGYLKRVK